MTTKLKIRVTKEILERSKDCNKYANKLEHCAIALAVRDIFPKALVYGNGEGIEPFGELFASRNNIQYPPEVRKFIIEFDCSLPQQRPLLPELEFEVDIPDSVIEKINIEELKPLLENHPTLELI